MLIGLHDCTLLVDTTRFVCSSTIQTHMYRVYSSTNKLSHIQCNSHTVCFSIFKEANSKNKLKSQACRFSKFNNPANGLLFAKKLVLGLVECMRMYEKSCHVNFTNPSSFQSLKVVDRGSETQPRVTENLN